jgi:glycosyltransferase involved in cell wall biosynthesis
LKFSIITPSFNQGAFLEQTIDSVLSQGVDLEYIVIDGGSKDNSLEIIKKYQRHLAYWVSETDLGQSHAINKGLKKATGEIANWINSDDYLQPRALQIIREHFLDPNINVVAGRSNIIQESKILRESNGTDLYKDNFAKTLGWARIDQPETYFRKKIFDQLGFLNERLHFIMDKEFWIRYLLSDGLMHIKKIPDVLVNFRLHANSKTLSKTANFLLEENSVMYQVAKANNLHQIAYAMSQILPITATDANPGYVIADKVLAGRALSYFLLYRADEYYYQEDHNKCMQLLSIITREHLNDKDLQLYKKLNFRSAYVPVFLKRISHRWK